MSDLGKRRLGDSWLVLPAKRGISVLRLRCVAHVLAVSILVHLPPMPRESYEQRSATQQSLQLWLVLFESISCWGSEGKRAVAATSSAHSSTPCCTSARETPFVVILSRLCVFYRRKTIRSESSRLSHVLTRQRSLMI